MCECNLAKVSKLYACLRASLLFLEGPVIQYRLRTLGKIDKERETSRAKSGWDYVKERSAVQFAPYPNR